MAQTNANNGTQPSMCAVWHGGKRTVALRWRV